MSGIVGFGEPCDAVTVIGSVGAGGALLARTPLGGATLEGPWLDEGGGAGTRGAGIAGGSGACGARGAKPDADRATCGVDDGTCGARGAMALDGSWEGVGPFVCAIRVMP
jgi:hypothetical protein